MQVQVCKKYYLKFIKDSNIFSRSSNYRLLYVLILLLIFLAFFFIISVKPIITTFKFISLINISTLYMLCRIGQLRIILI